MKRLTHFKIKIKKDDGTQITIDFDESWGENVKKGSRSEKLMMYRNVVVAATNKLQLCVKLGYTVDE